MSAPINDGGPAFPLINEHTHPTTINNGMTLRDYFAGQALAGISPHIEAEVDKLNPDGKYFDQRLSEWYQCAAIRAYCYADAMLDARKRKEAAQ
jgi:hypothetical protein